MNDVIEDTRPIEDNSLNNNSCFRKTSNSISMSRTAKLRLSPYSNYIALLNTSNYISIHDLWKLNTSSDISSSNTPNNNSLDNSNSCLKKYKPQNENQIYDIKFHPKHDLLLSSTDENTILYHNYLQPKRFNKHTKIIKHSAPIRKFEFTNKGEEIVFYSNNYLFSFDLNSNKIMSNSTQTYLKRGNSFKGVYEIKNIENTNYTITLHYDNYMRVWDNRTLKVVKEYFVPITNNELPYYLSFNYNNKGNVMVVSTSKHSSMSLFDLRADCLKEYNVTNQNSNIKELKYPFPISVGENKNRSKYFNGLNCDNDLWLVGTQQGVIVVDDKLDMKFEMDCHTSPVVDMCWGQNNKTLVTVSEQKELSTWFLSS
eukprot:GAHX01001889.1.p1 GENE.GAHX01001889.1~~GAHX01001889.1.p1  ORF type:complete len:370 (-),score=71.69 GAHX01001889.1:185-1294(-)